MVEKVVVTGMGVVSPLGCGVTENWKNLVGAGLVPARRDIQSEESDFRAGTRPAPTGFDRARELSLCAATEALTDAGLWDGSVLTGVHPERVGCTFSASKPLFSDGASLGSGLVLHHHGAKRDLTPAVHSPEVMGQMVREQFGISGETRNVVAACATGAYSIALGASWIEQGYCDVVVAGSVEPYPHALIAAGFEQMGVTSRDGVTRPFDQRRSGFTFGEGAGVVILESASSANGRHARAHGRLSGWALGADPHSAVAFNSNGAHIAGVIERALSRARLTSADVRHVNAHGTATRLNDRIETQALTKAFGARADRLMISATKASTGHLLGASGSVEFIFTLLALGRHYIPPTATLEEPDPECVLDYTPGKGHSASFEHALSLSFGFGGPIGALVVSAHD